MNDPQRRRSKWEAEVQGPWRLIPNLGLPLPLIPAMHGVWALVLACSWYFHNLESREFLALFIASFMAIHYVLRSLAGKSGTFLLGSGEITMWEHREIVFVFDLFVVLAFVGSLLQAIFGPGTLSTLWRLWLSVSGLG